MRSFLKFLVVATGIILLSALLAPVLYNFMPFKFEKIFNRLIMIFSLAASVLFLRPGRHAFEVTGLLPEPGRFKLMGVCFASGFGALAILVALRFSFGEARWLVQELNAAGWAYKIAAALGAAFLIAAVEESFFRGFVFLTLKGKWGVNVGMSLAVTSLFYSLLHFVSLKKPLIGPDPSFWDSLRLTAAPFMSLAQWQSLWPGALGLFLFGLVLNDLFVKTGSLWAPIGLHAGCVFFVKVDGLLAELLSARPLFWGTGKMVDGIINWFFLAGLFVFFRIILKNSGGNRVISNHR